jgi:RNA polymerase sigma-70 factor (ECF subfamily)
MEDKRLVTYCIVPPELADGLHDVLREHYRSEPSVEVLVEQRATERRGGERRARGASAAAEEQTTPAEERRRIRARGGRRIAERRAVQASVEALGLPAEAEAHRERLRFVERLEPTTVEREDADTARLVARMQAGDADIFTRLYERYFDRVYAYLRLTLQDAHEAEDVTQEVFIRVLQALPKYERRSSPFRAWLFRIVRNQALDRLRQRGRLRVEPPEEMASLAEAPDGQSEQLDWLDDRQLLGLIEQLPLAQRQVIVLRYMLELRSGEIGEVLERSPEAVRQLHQRAMRFLRERLDAGGNPGSTGSTSGGDRGAQVRQDAGSPSVRRNASRRLVRQAPVLRSRRFILR